jgi:hypothetical protein
MKKIINIFILLFFTNILIAQEFWLSTGCYHDTYANTSTSSSDILYGKMEIGLFREFNNGRIFHSANNGLSLLYITYVKPYIILNNCPNDSQYYYTLPQSNFSLTMNMKLYKNNVLIDTIVPDFIFPNGSDPDVEFQNQINNWPGIQNLTYGDGYQLKFHFTEIQYPNYYNPFQVSRTLSTPTFAIVRNPTFLYPNPNSINIELNPIISWEDMGSNAQYKIVIGPSDNPPVINYDSNTKTYSVSNALYTSSYISTTNYQLPITLNHNTEYSIDIIVNYDGVETRTNTLFSTREVSVIEKDISFYQQGVTPNPNNPNNYLNQDKPIRFKVKVKNELPQNLSTLTATLSCNTPGVTISDNTVNFGNIQSGNMAWSNDEFEITVDPSVANGTLLEFELSCNDSFVNGGPWTSLFSFPIAPLQNSSVSLVDNLGDNDGIPEPGENGIKIQPQIENVSSNTLAEVRGILSSDDTFLNITQNNEQYNVSNNVPEPVNPGDTGIVPAFPYEFNYPANEYLQELNFSLELQGKLNNSNGALLKWKTNFSFNDGIEPPPSIVTTNPQDDAVDIAVDTDLSITFDKPVTAVSGKNIYLYNGNNLEITIPVTDSQVSIVNELVTIDLNQDLADGSDYYVLIDSGAFIDNSSQDFEGINNPVVWNFTTIQNNPPVAPVLNANVLSENEIELNWNNVADADAYQVMSCDETITYATGLTTTTYTASNLNASTTYNFIVKAENSAGFSPASNCETQTTLCGAPWGSPVIYTTYTRAFCEVTIDGQPAEEHDKVAAFVGTELRGIGDVFISNGVAYAVVSIQGNAIETASFKVWDSSECRELSVNYTTATNPSGTIGAAPNYLPIAAQTAGIDSDNLLKNINVYPIPTENKLYIQTAGNIQINQIIIYDLLGNKVLDFDKPDNTISIAKLSIGVYFMQIKTQNGNTTLKILKN